MSRAGNGRDGVMALLSARAGNYQYNPQWGIMLSQLWVR
jgi:hypothetical protein